MVRMQLRNALVMILILSLCTHIHAAALSSQVVRIAGTYSDLRYNEESGDLIGMEVKLVPVVGERLQAVIVVSEGEPAPLVVVNVQRKERTVSFRVSGNGDAGWSFQGIVSLTSLKGTVTYGNGVRRTVTLRRGCGYWDR